MGSLRSDVRHLGVECLLPSSYNLLTFCKSHPYIGERIGEAAERNCTTILSLYKDVQTDI